MTDYQTQQKHLSDWWQTPLGRVLALEEQQGLANLKKYFYGRSQLQIGGHENSLPRTLHSDSQRMMAWHADFAGLPEAMPLRTKSLDHLLIQHVLEFSQQPHQILREAERVLVDDGHLTLCLINPLSLWGIKRLLSWQDKMPWQGYFYTQARVRDWLALLGFEVLELQPVLFRPPFNNHQWHQKWHFIERWGRRLWPMFSGAFILVAVKRTVPVNPIHSKWRFNPAAASSRFINKPVTRNRK